MILAITFIAAIVASLLVTPLVRGLARQLGFVDRPDGRRKTHSREVALGGGAVILIATASAVALGYWLNADHGIYNWERFFTSRFFQSLVAATLLTVAVGLIDDLTSMRGHFKLVGQIAAAAILIFYGELQISEFTFLGNKLEFGTAWVSYAFTMLWLLGAINAINLIDGIDGLASSVGFVLCLAVAALTIYQGNLSATLIVLALAGALLGFLKFNFAPASIFLGDAGSMFIGLVVGAMAIPLHYKSTATVALAVPFAVWSIPILDSIAAILRRKLTGRSLFVADRGHLHHSLLVRGWTVRQSVLFIGLICATTCVAALVCVYVGTVLSEILALGTVVAVTVFLISTKTFGHIEFALLRDHVKLTTRALATRDVDQGGKVQERRISLQGTQDWERLWMGLTESAERYSLTSIRLSIDIPSVHESFFGTWKLNPEQADAANTSLPEWRVAAPLRVDGKQIGQLVVSGAANDRPTLAHISQVLDFAEPIEDDIREILSRLRESAESAQTEVTDVIDSAKEPEVPAIPTVPLGNAAAIAEHETPHHAVPSG